MRTTLTLDDDVAKAVERLRKARGASMRDIVNQALREGLKHVAAPTRRRRVFRTTHVNLGICFIENVDNVAEVLAVTEGEVFK